MESRELARIVMERVDALGQISDQSDGLTRTFCSPAMRRANELVGSWMREAGMTVRQDPIGNIIGRYPAAEPGEKTMLLGSHLDTVRDAGRFDGPLGVIVAIACVQNLSRHNILLPFAIEVVGFSDEEGVRYQSTYLGSSAIAGTFDLRQLRRTDSQGITMAEAIRTFGGNPDNLDSAKMRPDQLVGYAEVHIEQGPVLEQKNLAVGVVSAISGQARIAVTFTGRAGHAGTTPMDLRQDALCAAAEFVLAAEAAARDCSRLVATVGHLNALPGASNVIPGQAQLSLDVRHADGPTLEKHVAKLKASAEQIAHARRQTFVWELVQQNSSVPCDAHLSALLAEAVSRHQPTVLNLSSGAGHDAVAMASITPVTMLFVRCRGGVSHHPDEFVEVNDIETGIAVMTDFLSLLAKQAPVSQPIRL